MKFNKIYKIIIEFNRNWKMSWFKLWVYFIIYLSWSSSWAALANAWGNIEV